MRTLTLLLFIALTFSGLSALDDQKNRVIILTDIEADPDDTQSLVRLLLYANEIDIKGLVATTSCWLKNEVNPESITKVIRAYEQVHPNLLLHDADFPAAPDLIALVKSSIPKYGMEGVGEGLDTEGSELIIQELEKEDDRPLWISTWGGVNTLAQALYKMENTMSKKELKKMISKLRVYTISDQDDAGIWLRNRYPELFYIVSPGDHYASATWSSINTVVKGIDNKTISNPWLAENIQQGHGPLGVAYPDVAWGMEGDTPAFLYLILNGLNEPEHPEWGGWGGRYELYKPEHDPEKKGNSGVPNEAETRPIWTNASDKLSPYGENEYGRNFKRSSETFEDNKVSLWRWRDDFQNDFAARMDWCTMSYKEANHAPEIVLSHPEKISLKSGQGQGFDAFETTDPDGDSFSFLWYVYPEAGSKKESKIGGTENAHGVYWTAPEVEKEETVHMILKVTDRGEPRMCSYKRIVITVTPK